MWNTLICSRFMPSFMRMQTIIVMPPNYQRAKTNDLIWLEAMSS